MKRLLERSLALLLLALSVAPVSSQPTDRWFTQGRFLYAPGGQQMVVRGPEQVFWQASWLPNTIVTEVGKTKANTIRILPFFTQATPTGEPPSTLAQIEDQIQRGIAANMLVDVAIDGGKSVATFTRADVKTMLFRYQDHIVLHAKGESGESTGTEWANNCISIVNQLRSAGYICPFYLMANTFGRNLPTILNHGQSVVNADPQHNVVFGWQAYWGSSGYYQNLFGMTLFDGVQACANASFPIQIGLLLHSDPTINPNETIPYSDMFRWCQERQLSWLWWDWRMGTDQITTDGVYGHWTSVGNDVVIANANGINNTSVKPPFLGGPGGSPPAAPSGLTATAVSSSQINLAWTDNANNETGFKIERKTGAGGTYSQIATVGANVTTYNNTGLAASTTYYYRVRANNANGDSAYSNEANATTQAAGAPNIALNKPATASSSESATYSPDKAVDGNTTTRWSSLFSDPQWIRVDLQNTYNINRVRLNWEAAYGRAYQIQVSNDGASWTTIFSTTTGDGGIDDLTSLSGTGRYVRMNGTQRATGWGYSLWEFEVYGTLSLPSPWQTADIGAVAAAGSASYASATFTVRGSGADIWGTADEFRYVYQSASGDCEIRARVATQQNTDGWAKSGVMIRETLGANSRHAMMAVTPANGLAFQYRTTTGGSSTHVAGGAGTAPYWVRLVRAGSTITAYKSTNGSTWTTVGSVSISMTTAVQIGLAVSSHLDGTLNTSTFDNVTATP